MRTCRSLLACLLVASVRLNAQTPGDTARVFAEVSAAEAARLRGDSAAWKLMSPGFVFVHSTGAVNDRAAYLAFRSRGPAPAAGRVPELRDAQPPVVHLDGETLVTVRSLADPAPAGTQAHESRVLDVYVKRAGAWQWLAHQTSEVTPRWAPATTDSASLDEYAGTYRSSDGLQRVFARRGSRLVQVTPAAERPMIALSDASFGYSGLVATVTFVRDRTGRVVAVDESAQVGFRRYTR